MSSTFKLQLLKYLRSSRSNAGFTLTELLVVLMIMAILGAIAMPNFVQQAAKARQSEAKQNLGLINRAQAHYRTEHNRFSDSFDLLAVGGGLKGVGTADTSNYIYELNSSNLSGDTAVIAYPKDTGDRSYSGGNAIYSNSVGQLELASLICESKSPGVGTPPIVQVTATGVDCPNADYHRLDDTGKGN
jgi:type IV pilus assembly protein PilA